MTYLKLSCPLPNIIVGRKNQKAIEGHDRKIHGQGLANEHLPVVHPMNKPTDAILRLAVLNNPVCQQ